jgi:hypothetical protein
VTGATLATKRVELISGRGWLRAFPRLLSRHSGVCHALLLLPAVLSMVRGLNAPVHGSHLFRQTHVAANIEKYVSHGLSLRPETYNVDVPFAVFDFPLYQLAVAAASRVLHAAPIPTARALNVLVLIAAAAAIRRILSRTGATTLSSLLTVAFFVYAPLTVVYGHAPFVDPLAVTLSLVSLAGFSSWEAGEESGFAVMLAAGVLSTVIKSPVYLPVFVAILWRRFRRGGPAALKAVPVIVFALAIAASVVGFRLYSDTVNDVHGLTAYERAADEYFAAPAVRFRLEDWQSIAGVLIREVLSPIGVLLSAFGLARALRPRARRAFALPIGLLLGSVLALLLFFQKHFDHDYYQLPFVFPLAFFAARGAYLLVVAARAAERRRQLRWAAPVVLTITAVAVAATWLSGFRLLDSWPSVWAENRGAWLQLQTAPDDFVVYVLGAKDNWNPAYLYFAHRDGCNLARGRVGRLELESIRARFGPRYHRLLVFCPPSPLPAAEAEVESLGARLLAEGRHGRLYELPADFAGGIRDAS